MQPRTWTEREIVALIEAEIMACRVSGNAADRQPKSMAEAIFASLDEIGLIERTP